MYGKRNMQGEEEHEGERREDTVNECRYGVLVW